MHEKKITNALQTELRSAPTKRCKTFIKQKRWCDEMGINMCLILQNMLDVTVTAQNTREHPNPVNKRFVETVIPNYCDPTFASFQTFQVKDNPFLISKSLLLSIWPYYFYCEYKAYRYCWSLLLCYDIEIFTINQRSIEKFMKVSLHNTIEKYNYV